MAGKRADQVQHGDSWYMDPTTSTLTLICCYCSASHEFDVEPVIRRGRSMLKFTCYVRKRGQTKARSARSRRKS